MPFVTATDGPRLRYELEGTGPPLLLHLGAGCDSDLWRAAGYLAPLSATHTCILFDHRGHGQSDHPAGGAANRIDRYAADVITLLDELQLPSVAFWGYSNAIAVGVKVADAAPARIERLVLSGAVVSGSRTREQLLEMLAGPLAAYRSRGWEALIEGFEAQEGPVPEWMKARIRATDLEPVIGWSESRPDWGWSIWDALPRVRVPGLFVVGALEDPEDAVAEVAARMPFGRRVRVPDRGHIGAFLEATFVLPHVQEFLGASAGT